MKLKAVSRRLRDYVAHRVPVLGRYKRYVVAAKYSFLPRKRTYAQHGEDVAIGRMLGGFDLREAMYVDIGANHPTTISNTYLLYRRGCKGIVVDANRELVALFDTFRPRDIAIAAGCSDETGVAAFTISKTPVVSSLDPSIVADPWKTVYVPLLTVDSIVGRVDPPWVCLLSVDVEGHAGAVLRGAAETLRRTYVLCVEAPAGSEEEAEVLEVIEQEGFVMAERNEVNIIALSGDPAAFDRFKRR